MASIALQRFSISLKPSLQTLKRQPFLSPIRISTNFPPNSIKPLKIKINHSPPWKEKKIITTVTNCCSSSDDQNQKPVVDVVDVPLTERLISTIAYTVPFIDGFQYGTFIFLKNPSLWFRLLKPIFPLLLPYWSIPFMGLLSLLGLYFVVVRNPKFSRFLRFNLMVALVIDVVFLLLPLLLRFVNLGDLGESGLGFRLMEMSCSSIFVLLFGCFVYNVGFSVVGKTPRLPIVAEAVDRLL